MTLWLTAALLMAPVVSAQDPADEDLSPPAPVVEEAPKQAPSARDPADEALADEPAASAPAPVPSTGGPVDLEPPALPPLPGGHEDDDGEPEEPLEESLPGLGVLVGSGAGYAVGAAVPAVGVLAGGGVMAAAVILAQGASDSCEAFFYLCGGVFIASAIVAPSVLSCGPCSAGGAAIGSGVGAASSGRELLWPIVGALPGVIAGFGGSVLAVAGLLVASTSGETVPNGGLGCAITMTGLAFAALAGPIAVAGAVLADVVVGSHAEPRERAPDELSLRLDSDDERQAPQAPPHRMALTTVAY